MWIHAPPHPRPNKTPQPSKGRGPTIAIYSYLYLSIARWVNINPQTQLGTFFSGFPKVFTASGPCSSSRGGRFMVWVNHGLIIRQIPISIHMILNGSEWELMVSNLLLISIQEPLFLISNIPMVFLMFVWPAEDVWEYHGNIMAKKAKTIGNHIVVYVNYS